MDKKTIYRDFAKYVSLSVLGMTCFSVYVLADTFFIANALGANGLTALNFSISIFSILQGVSLMIGIGGATRYTILKNEDNNKDANLLFTHSLAVGSAFAFVFVIVGALFTESLASLLGSDEIILPLAATYIRTIMLFSPFMLLNNILIAFIRNDNNPKLAMAGMVTGSLSNIVLDYIFLFPLSMGMFGAALATGLSLIISLFVLSLHFLTKRSQFFLCKCKIYIKKIADIFSLGSSAMVSELSFAVALITFNLVIFRIEGNIGVAAYGIVANIALVLLFIFTGVAQGIQPLLSKGYGSNDKTAIVLTFRSATALVLILSVSFYSIVNIFSDSIVSVFNSEANAMLARLAINGIRIYFTGLIFAGVNIVTAAFFSAINNAKLAFIISILRSCVIIVPMVIALSFFLKMNGVWLSFALTEFIIVLLSVILLKQKSLALFSALA